MGVATDIELKQNIEKYLAKMRNGDEITVTDENGNRIGKFIPETAPPQKNLSIEEVNEIIKSLTGIIKNDYDFKEEKEIYLREKYGLAD